jgi:hypothetical protein
VSNIFGFRTSFIIRKKTRERLLGGRRQGRESSLSEVEIIDEECLCIGCTEEGYSQGRKTSSGWKLAAAGPELSGNVRAERFTNRAVDEFEGRAALGLECRCRGKGIRVEAGGKDRRNV